MEEALVTEADLLTWCLDLLAIHGWAIHHDRPARTEKGWRTAIQGDTGYPDVTAVNREGFLIVVELKSLKGRVTDMQVGWLDRFAGHGHDWQAEPFCRQAALRRVVGLVKPVDRDELAAILSSIRKGHL